MDVEPVENPPVEDSELGELYRQRVEDHNPVSMVFNAISGGFSVGILSIPVIELALYILR